MLICFHHKNEGTYRIREGGGGDSAEGRNISKPTRQTDYVCIVFTVSRSFYPTTPLHPKSVPILHPREVPGTNFVVTDCKTE